MNGKFTILFYDDGEPVDPRCIKRFLSSFPNSYTKVVTGIIESSKALDEEHFKKNIGTLIPNFGMTRKGALSGIKIGKNGKLQDPNGIVDECWKKIGADLLAIKLITNNSGRALQELQGKDREYVINKTSELFKTLCGHVNARSGQITRVGASKILFSVLPEIAVPVDTAEWNKVFRTKDNYKQILTTMTDEISEWEEKTKEKINRFDPNEPKTTLPAIYNVMAMSARP